ncbi:11586_t:CDS:2, partial [Dentiscutata heterogama]
KKCELETRAILSLYETSTTSDESKTDSQEPKEHLIKKENRAKNHESIKSSISYGPYFRSDLQMVNNFDDNGCSCYPWYYDGSIRESEACFSVDEYEVFKVIKKEKVKSVEEYNVFQDLEKASTEMNESHQPDSSSEYTQQPNAASNIKVINDNPLVKLSSEYSEKEREICYGIFSDFSKNNVRIKKSKQKPVIG